MNDWYPVFCKPRREATAEMNLVNQGYAVYLPQVITQHRRAGKWADRLEPLFPRYLFLRARDAAQSLAPVRSTPGAVGLVKFGGQPAVISNEIVEALRAREENGPGSRRAVFKVGDLVKFVEGPLSGLEAVFSKEAGEERVMVLLELLGKINNLQVSRDWLVPAG